MGSFYNEEELKALGLRSYGENVLISRNAIIYSPADVEIASNVRVDDFAILSGSIILHSYIHIAQFCGLYGGDASIEMHDYTSLSSKTSIYAVSDDYSGESMTNPMIPMQYKPGAISKKVELLKYTAVGASCVLLPGITLNEGCAIAAMSLVVKDADEWSVYAGVPARRVKERSQKLLGLAEQFEKECRKQ